MVSDISCSSTSTTSTRLSPTSRYVIFMTCVLYPIFQEKSIGNGLRYVRGLKVMLIDVDNVKPGRVPQVGMPYFRNTYDTCFIPNFSREIDWECLRYIRGLQVMLIDVDNVNQAESHKWVRHVLKNT